jgi:hypothetical protein
MKAEKIIMNYYEFVKNYLGTDSCKEKSKYCNIGTTFAERKQKAVIGFMKRILLSSRYMTFL